MHGRIRSLLAVLALVSATMAVSATAAGSATASPSNPTSASAPGVQRSCAAPKPGKVACFAMVRSGPKRMGVTPDAAPPGFGPADLQDAYDLPSATGGDGQTVAVVDAFDDPNAEADLAVYRSQFGLPPCTTANGCFRKVDQRGGTDYPLADTAWAQEISLDLDMVSAVCPRCHILLVEADEATNLRLGQAVDTAVQLGAKYVSNSYGSQYSSAPGSGEDPGQLDFDAYFDHPGVAIVASSGDSGYGVSWPAAAPTVTSVGGTSLHRDASTARGWTESVWNNEFGGPGSGCSVVEPKPSFQTDSDCPNRTVADVSAVGDPLTGVAAYDSYNFRGWAQFGGTSAGSPIIASTYALAGTPPAGSAPNSFPYAAGAAALNDVTTGANGECSPAYLCTAGPGYDGPTGLGTPHGITGFSGGPAGALAGHVTEAGTGVPLAGVEVSATGQVSADIVTDAHGDYRLPLLVGDYDVTIADYAHEPHTVSDVTVTKGNTVTIDAELIRLPTTTVSGTVTDGSGHGWPLHARVTVDGIPGPPIYTDPYTGQYHITLPQQAMYTIRATPVAAGYIAATGEVQLGTTATTRDLSATVDQGTCAAPGYRQAAPSTVEGFDDPTAPAGWTVTSITGASWVFDDPYGRGNHTGGTGGFAIADIGPIAVSTATFLVSPPVDLTGAVVPQVAFDLDDVGPARLTVDTSTDGGATWQNVWTADASTEFLGGPLHQRLRLPLSVATAGVQVRFGYIDLNHADNWWALDNVAIWDGQCAAVPGGLVSGTVTDQNTGQPVDRARVGADSGEFDISAASDDAALGHGFYTAFVPAGARTLTATAARYQQASRAVQIDADTVTRADIALPAGRLSVSAADLAATLDMGEATTRTVTITNDGTAPAHVALAEHTAPAPSTAGAPVRRTRVTNPLALVSGNAPSKAPSKAPSTDSATESVATDDATGDPAWTDGADYPMSNPVSTMSAYDSADGKVYTLGWSFFNGIEAQEFYVYDPMAQVWTPRTTPPLEVGFAAIAFVDGRIVVAGGLNGNQVRPPVEHAVASVQIYDPATDTWSTGADLPEPRFSAGAAVLDGDLYVVGGCAGELGCATAPSVADVFRYDIAGDRWSAVADYPARENELACAGVRGEVVCAGGINGAWASGAAVSRSTYVYNPATDVWSPGADLPIDLFMSAYAAAGGQLVVAGGLTAQATQLTNQAFAYHPDTDAWTALPNANHAIFGGSATCGLVTVGAQQNTAFTPIRTQHLAGYGDCGDGVDTPWLAETPATLDLAPGHSATVTVTLDAGPSAVTQPGTYAARLDLVTDTPYPTAPVTATMTVLPPKRWGQLAGVVSGRGCDGTVVPLAGATVQIDTSTSHRTLTTDQTGRYALWLDRGNNPLTVVASLDGWHAQSATVRIKAGRTTTADFTLATTLTCS